MSFILIFCLISDPPKVQLTLGKNIDPLSIAEGNDVYLDCSIKANPRAYKVEWMHNVSLNLNFNNSKGPFHKPILACSIGVLGPGVKGVQIFTWINVQPEKVCIYNDKALGLLQLVFFF